METVPAALRPHAKIHKSPVLGRMQVDAGAIGLTTATVWEASAMVAGGLTGILVCNQAVGAVKAAELARLAGGAEVIVLVESDVNADELSAAAARAGTEIGVLVELDVGLHRSGVRRRDDAVTLAEHVERAAGLRLRGPFGYEGHCMLEPDRDVRVTKQATAMEGLFETVDHLAANGFECEIVSAGGTGTYDLIAAHPRVTELQAGSYVFMDAFHGSLIPGFDIALTVLATVMGRHGDRVILDAGRKGVGIDLRLPEVVGIEATTAFVDEEHSGYDVPSSSPLRYGDTVELLAGYGPTTVNLYGHYHVIEDGVVSDIWPVMARYGSDTAVEKGARARV